MFHPTTQKGIPMSDQERLSKHVDILIDAIAKVAGTAMASINNLHPAAIRESLLIALVADCQMSHGMSDDEGDLLIEELRELIAGRISDAGRNRN